MNSDDWFRSHVERCLQQIFSAEDDDSSEEPEPVRLPDLEPDADGDYGFRSGSAACYIGVDAGAPMVVRVWAVAASGVRRTARLLGELNDINSRTRSAHALLISGSVLVEQMIHAEGVCPQTLTRAIDAVSAVSNDIGLLVAGVYGGTTPFSVEDTVGDEVA